MMNLIRENFDIKTFLITGTLSVGWIFGTDLLVHTFLSSEQAEIAQTFKGTVFVIILSIILAIFHGREKNILKKSQKDFDRLFRKGLTPTLLICAVKEKVLEANHSAMALLGHNHKSIYGLPMEKIFVDKEDWDHILKDVRKNKMGHAYLKSMIEDREKTKSTHHLQISSFQFKDSPAYLVFIQKEGS